MLRLLLVSSEFPPGPGGIGSHAFHLARQLTSAGWEVKIASPQDYAAEEEIVAFNAAQPFAVTRLKHVGGAVREAIYRWQTVQSALNGWQPDIIGASGTRAVWLSAMMARVKRLPWVAVGHGTEFGTTLPLERMLTRTSFEAATAIVCVSQYTWGRMLGMGIRPQGGVVIPNGADDERFVRLSTARIDQARERLGHGDARLILTVGNVTERKGQDVVIRAMPHILQRVPNTHYLIAGLPTKRAEFQALAESLGVARHVHFLGRCDAETLVELYNAADLFVMTSRHTASGDFEGYGIAVVEAAFCGKPAVVSANSGLAEAITHGETGLVVPEGDARATAEAISTLLEDNPHRMRMGEAARERAYREQTWSQRVREYDTLLASVVKTAAGGQTER